MKYSNALATFVVIIHASQASPILEQDVRPIHKCIKFVIFFPMETCTFRNLLLNETQQHFTPVAAVGAPDEVKSVDIGGKRGSSMKILTSDICDAFPNVQWYDAYWLGLEDIREDAFVGCSDLEKLRLYDNKLTSLSADLFKNNPKLRYLDVDMNRFKELNVNVFSNTPMIEHLNFNDNQIKKFEANELPLLEKLKMLRLANNLISDIDEEKIAEKCPALKEFIICPNEKIEYSRLRAITDFSKGRGVLQFGVCRR